jgi:hypothetical protein
LVHEIVMSEMQPHMRQYHFDHHYAYLRNYAEFIGAKVDLIKDNVDPRVWSVCFPGYSSILVDDKQLFVDVSDLYGEGILYKDIKPYNKYVKYYYYPADDKYSNIYPSGSQLDIRGGVEGMEYFFYLCKEDIYKPEDSDRVISTQRPHTRALKRRRSAQNILISKYGSLADIRHKLSQKQLWENCKDCLVSVVVPGACEICIDRWHYEQMALGICTISTSLETPLPWNVRLEPNVHYIECKRDFSDLVCKIEWCKKNRNECKAIGQRVAKLFDDYCAPIKFWEWIDKILT